MAFNVYVLHLFIYQAHSTSSFLKHQYITLVWTEGWRNSNTSGLVNTIFSSFETIAYPCSYIFKFKK